MGKYNGQETKREKLWKECVQEGKVLAKMNQESRLKIVKLAEKCCVIHFGGRNFENRFTVTNFANEIGINPHTLLEWIRLKKNVLDNLDAETQKTVKQTDLQLIDRELKGIKRGTEEYKTAVRATTKIILSSTGSTRKMMKYQKHMTTMLFNVKHKAMINDCDRKVLVEILHTAREIAKHLEWVDFEMKAKPKTVLRQKKQAVA